MISFEETKEDIVSKITPEEAHEFFRYDPESGQIFWRHDRRKARAGAEAGTIYRGRLGEYRQVCFNYKIYRTHRLAWLLMTGDWPRGEIDHIDGDGLNNRWGNLRDVSRQENSCNRRVSSDNTSGYHGISWHRLAKKWSARICHAGKHESLGLYSDLSEAVAARDKAERRLGFHDNHGKR